MAQFALIVKMKSKKSQIWYFDFLIGFTAFFLVLIITVEYVSYNFVLPQGEIDEVFHRTLNLLSKR